MSCWRQHLVPSYSCNLFEYRCCGCWLSGTVPGTVYSSQRGRTRDCVIFWESNRAARFNFNYGISWRQLNICQSVTGSTDSSRRRKLCFAEGHHEVVERGGCNLLLG